MAGYGKIAEVRPRGCSGEISKRIGETCYGESIYRWSRSGIGLNGEIRFDQRASYEGEHHELGILFVQDEHEHEEMTDRKSVV